MIWLALLALSVPLIVGLNIAFLFIGDQHSAPKKHVKLVRPPDYNEEAKDDGVEREVMEVDALFVGAGPAGLAGAYHLMQLCKKHDEAIEKGEKKGDKLGEVQICVLEKCSEIGAMGISGMVMDPKALRELIPDFEAKGAPLDCKVEKESMHFLLSPTVAAPVPMMPPPLMDHGLYIGSLSKFARWLATLCEEQGIMLFPGFAGAYMMYEGENDAVVGVRTGDKGIGHNGEKKRSFEPGVNMKSKVTVLTEGTRGSLTRDAVRKLKLDEGKNPNSYCLGVKEVIEVPPGQMPAGEVVLTAGWPLGDKTYGGSFMYSMKDNLVALGLMVGLDYTDPNTDPQVLLQRMKTHPLFQKYLKGGKVIQYGAKTVPLGGWHAMPKLYSDGLMLAGDSGGLVNAERLKGVHLAIKSGMLAAEVAFDALVAKDYSAKQLAPYQKKIEESWAGQEMWKARNFHSNFHDGLAAAVVKNGLAVAPVIGGLINDLNKTRTVVEADYETKRPLTDVGGLQDIKKGIPYDGKLFMDKLSDVYLAGSKGEEDQPSHLQVINKSLCADDCAETFGNPCTRACPANVYEMVDDESKPGKKKLHLNPTNCVHCKTCDLIDPYINIRWVVPEGGDGPNYSQM